MPEPNLGFHSCTDTTFKLRPSLPFLFLCPSPGTLVLEKENRRITTASSEKHRKRGLPWEKSPSVCMLCWVQLCHRGPSLQQNRNWVSLTGSQEHSRFLLSRAAVSYQHVDLSAAVQRRVHTEGKEKGMLCSFFLDLTCSLAWLWENWASLSTTGFTVMMGREEPSHKGAEGLVSDRMDRGGHAEGPEGRGEEFLGGWNRTCEDPLAG